MTVSDAPGIIAEALPSYEVAGELGRGGMGVVYAGRHRVLGHNVAIKELPVLFASDPEVRARFLNEARILADLSHPHVVPVYDYVERDSLCLIVMEALPNGSVWERFCTSGFTPQAACALVIATLAGLHHAHSRQVLHRDIKPDNVMFGRDGVPKVTDFGIAKVTSGDSSRATQFGQVLGTPAYMAPEQAQGLELTPATDVYSCGVMLYELLASRLPFSEDGDALAILRRHVFEDAIPLHESAPQVPTAIADATMIALAREVEDRYHTAEDMAIGIGEAATSAWGVGWAETVGFPLMVHGPLLASIERTTQRPRARTLPPPTQVGGPGQPPPPLAPLPPATRPPTSPVGPTTRPPASQPGPPTIGPTTIGPTTIGPTTSRPPTAMPRPAAGPAVRPAVTAHVGGADVMNLRPAELVPVAQLLKPPSARLPFAMAALLAVLIVVSAIAGVGTSQSQGTPGVSVAGIQTGSREKIKLDLQHPIPVGIASSVGTPDSAQLSLEALGVPLGSSSRTPVTPGPDGLAASIKANGSRFLVAGEVTGQLVLRTGDSIISRTEFAATSQQNSFLTVPGVLAILMAAAMVSFLESILRPLRRGRRRRGSAVTLALVGSGLGMSFTLLVWVAGLARIAVASLAIGGALGAAMGVAFYFAGSRIGQRRRFSRRQAKPA